MAQYTYVQRTARSLTSTASSKNSSGHSMLYLAVGIAVGSAFLAAIAMLVVLIIRKRSRLRRVTEAHQVEHAIAAAQLMDSRRSAIPVFGNNAMIKRYSQHAWAALDSRETVSNHILARPPYPNAKKLMLLPKDRRAGGIRLKPLKRLTAIIESPRSRPPDSPRFKSSGDAKIDAGQLDQGFEYAKPKVYMVKKFDEDEDVFLAPGSPKPSVLPSFAIRSPGRYGANIANESGLGRPDTLTRARASSVTVLPNSRLHKQRPQMHARAFSLGAPLAGPPSIPVPPIPTRLGTVPPPVSSANMSNRQGLIIMRNSSISMDSVSSSLLITSPVIHKAPVLSPTVEQVVADDDNASPKRVQTRTWHRPPSCTAQSMSLSFAGKASDLDAHASIRSDVVRYSTTSRSSQPWSMFDSSLTNNDPGARNSLFVHDFSNFDRVNVTKISPRSSALDPTQNVQQITTPRRTTHKVSVCANGSPYERGKVCATRSHVLRDVSGNLGLPYPQASSTTLDSFVSGRSNPFQWDQPLTKPSAMKGSPNARKGHRRQNCVRISTLTPTILGPPRSRSSSPHIMFGIKEESPGGEPSVLSSRQRVAKAERPSRPLSVASYHMRSRPHSLRASLTTSSSAALCNWPDQENIAPFGESQSDILLGSSFKPFSFASTRSSILSLAVFPEPVHTTAATTTAHLEDHALPKVHLSRPSSELDLNESRDVTPPVPIHAAHQGDIKAAQRPPSPRIVPESSQSISRRDGAWNEFTFPIIANEQVTDSKVTRISDQSRKTSGLGLSELVFDQDTEIRNQAFVEKLTSCNASTIMARIPVDVAGSVDFPGAPILSPPVPQDLVWESKQAVANFIYSRSRLGPSGLDYERQRSSPSTVSRSNSHRHAMPAPLNVLRRTCLQGPRSAPAQSLVRSVVELRRMNSEVVCTPDGPERRYMRLGRESSPQLSLLNTPSSPASCDGISPFIINEPRRNATPDCGVSRILAQPLYSMPAAFGGASDTNHEQDLVDTPAGYRAMPRIDTSDPCTGSTVSLTGDNDSSSPTERIDVESPTAYVSNVAEPRGTPNRGFIASNANTSVGLPSNTLPLTPLDKTVSTTTTEGVEYRVKGNGSGRRSTLAQDTPHSFYDADGFLRT